MPLPWLACRLTRCGDRGLPAKPIIKVDFDMVVVDSSDEAAYPPSLEKVGFRLIAREPEREEHRCASLSDPNSNVHIFTLAAIERARHPVLTR